MKIAYRFLFVILISMLLFGCGDKTAGIEGKIVDGKGKPIAGVSMLFKQVQPTQGYEQFETKTGADGVFRLTGLAPSSDYVISILSVKWKTKITKKIKTLEAGQKLALSDPIRIRFNQMKDGTVVDTKTGLQWLIYPITNMNASNVVDTVKGLKEAGFADWRLPSRDELTSLHEDKIPAKLPVTEPVLVNKTCCAWVADPNTAVVDWKFYVEEDNELWTSNTASPDNRIIIVRNFESLPAALPAAAPAGGAVVPPVPGQTGAATQAIMPAAKSTPGVRHASRKACAEKRAMAARLPQSAPAAAPAPVQSAAKVNAPPSRIPEPAMNAAPAPPARSADHARISMMESIYFDAGSSTLKTPELAKLKALLAKIKGQKGTLIIDGHSDATAAGGSSNLMISFDRSYRVVAALNKMGAGKNIKVELKALGDGKPAAANDTAEGRSLNRRVDLSFIAE